MLTVTLTSATYPLAQISSMWLYNLMEISTGRMKMWRHELLS
jgi:hypothetical protein